MDAISTWFLAPPEAIRTLADSSVELIGLEPCSFFSRKLGQAMPD